MAALDYKSSLVRYHRYLQSVQKQPMFKASLFLVLSLLLIIVLVVVALKPTLVTIASLWGEIKQQREVEKKLDKKISALIVGQQLLLENEERLALLDEALPAAAQYGKWGKRMESLASQSGVKITVILEDEKKFTITAEGPYAQLRLFLGRVENLRRLMTIENMQITQKSSILNMTIRGLLESYAKE
ncbi:MAG: hypothetical protein UY27_C0031G0004 [Candidatus Gottesmanbacteria bacterium GW2011_GWA1_48_13]|uniref:Uncharacterized protein n=1 Tax=Candidatus Gottesmanbacteria bacterium GW2011_GWA1_48_13 TaxID=1618439 RepID=A0A0G1WWR2_9BACT|nr:MAG: hypothetical protein UY27_C0031G0004 [Candidatus Gottesmanbacteria bacterium GW2011_GWA1_48_13]